MGVGRQTALPHNPFQAVFILLQALSTQLNRDLKKGSVVNRQSEAKQAISIALEEKTLFKIFSYKTAGAQG